MCAGVVYPQRSKKLGFLSIVTVPGWRKTQFLIGEALNQNPGFALGASNSIKEVIKDL